MLKLTPDQFDQDMDGGWRILARRVGCDLAVADLIASYRKSHWGVMTPSQVHLSYWHEGQARAVAGHYTEARPLLMEGVNSDDLGNFADYALGTIAFLDHDLAALKAARERMANIPKPPNWDAMAASLQAKWKRRVTWPANLSVLDGLVACFDKPYREAYEDGKCRGD
jgi:hypothetical protein